MMISLPERNKHIVRDEISRHANPGVFDQECDVCSTFLTAAYRLSASFIYGELDGHFTTGGVLERIADC
jgi:hypothetical protein